MAYITMLARVEPDMMHTLKPHRLLAFASPTIQPAFRDYRGASRNASKPPDQQIPDAAVAGR